MNPCAAPPPAFPLPHDWGNRIVQLAAEMLDAPVAILTAAGASAGHPYAIAAKRHDVRRILAAVDDPTRLVDPEFARAHFAFHVAVPLDTSGRQRLGSLCVLDTRARRVPPANLDRLWDLAALTVHQAEFRIAVDRMARSAHALRAVNDGVNPVTGDRFFRTLVLQLTHTLGVDVAFVAESVGGGRGARTIAWCRDGSIQDNFVYPLPGTPCAVLWTEASCVVAAEVQQRFPDDPILKELGVQSYLGVRLHSNGAGPLGWLGIMHRRPVDAPDLALTILEVFASRASAEIERRRGETALRISQEVLERRCAERTAALHVANARLEAAERETGSGS